MPDPFLYDIMFYGVLFRKHAERNELPDWPAPCTRSVPRDVRVQRLPDDFAEAGGSAIVRKLAGRQVVWPILIDVRRTFDLFAEKWRDSKVHSPPQSRCVLTCCYNMTVPAIGQVLINMYQVSVYVPSAVCGITTPARAPEKKIAEDFESKQPGLAGRRGTTMSGSEEDRVATLADCCTQPSSSSSSPEDHVTMTTSPPTPGTPTQAASSPILIPVQRFRSSRGSDSGVSVGSFSPRHCHVCNSPRAYSPTVFVFPSPSARCRAYSPSRTQGTQTPSPLCQVFTEALQISEQGATGGGEVCRRTRNIRRVQSGVKSSPVQDRVRSQVFPVFKVLFVPPDLREDIVKLGLFRNLINVQVHWRLLMPTSEFTESLGSVAFRTRYHSESDTAASPTGPPSQDQMASDPLPDLLQFRARSRSEPVRVSPEELVARELRRISDEFDSLVFSPTQRRPNGNDRPASFGGRDLQEREQGQDWWSYMMAVFRSKSADNVVRPDQPPKREDDRDRGNDGSTPA
uniref:Bcl-x interacting BH3 domain-containing protein n=1 Tax=Branchiostoma floridae TaxID=7739 RepID=C3XZ81_BRAFL|eukprot:XP_002610635.1 hypothetical protein BRAFLDRAFT_65824 [Branchiostoma floridae]